MNSPGAGFASSSGRAAGLDLLTELGYQDSNLD